MILYIPMSDLVNVVKSRSVLIYGRFYIFDIKMNC